MKYCSPIFIIEIVFALFLFIQIIFSILYFFFPKYTNEYYTALGSSWYSSPIMDIELSSTKTDKSIPILKDEGYHSYCNCGTSYYKGKCLEKDKSSCKEVKETFETELFKWKGKYINLIRNNTVNLLSLNQYRQKKECNETKQSCGRLDRFHLCFNKDDVCPINYIKINKDKNPPDSNVKYKTLELSDGYYLHYTNEKTDGRVIVGFNVSEGTMCANPLRHNSIKGDHELYKGKDKCYCDNKYDYSYKYLDINSKYNFYEDNQMINLFTSIPNYPIDDLTITNYSLFSKGYIFPKLNNVTFNEISSTLYMNFNDFSNIHNIIRFVFFIIVLILISIFSIWRMKKSENITKFFEIKYYLLIRIAITFILLSVILFSILFLIYVNKIWSILENVGQPNFVGQFDKIGNYLYYDNYINYSNISFCVIELVFIIIGFIIRKKHLKIEDDMITINQIAPIMS